MQVKAALDRYVGPLDLDRIAGMLDPGYPFTPVILTGNRLPADLRGVLERVAGFGRLPQFPLNISDLVQADGEVAQGLGAFPVALENAPV